MLDFEGWTNSKRFSKLEEAEEHLYKVIEIFAELIRPVTKENMKDNRFLLMSDYMSNVEKLGEILTYELENMPKTDLRIIDPHSLHYEHSKRLRQLVSKWSNVSSMLGLCNTNPLEEPIEESNTLNVEMEEL